MRLSEWLDAKVAEGVDVSQIEIPPEVAFDDAADETVFYAEVNPCGMLCTQNHPYAKIERFGRWYFCKGQDKQAGIHSDRMKWRLITRDKDLALQTAKKRIE